MSARLPSGARLVGRWVFLDVLTSADIEEMYPLLADARGYEQGYVMHRRPASLSDAQALVRERFLPADSVPNGRSFGRTPYAVRLAGDSPLGAAGTLAGSSALMDADLANASIHLGMTYYGPRWWGTTVNPEAKLLLMTHAFEDCGYGRVKIQTDLLNTRSQAAIVKLGDQREGVLRRHMRRDDGTFRDSVVFSVLKQKWPAVKARLRARLEGTDH